MKSEAKHECLDVRHVCPLEAASAVVGGKWKSLILFKLLDGPVRFNALQRLMPCITRRMLTLQLRELENDGIVHREVFQQVPPKVEYSLTPLGMDLKKSLELLKQWGIKYLEAKPVCEINDS